MGCLPHVVNFRRTYHCLLIDTLCTQVGVSSLIRAVIDIPDNLLCWQIFLSFKVNTQPRNAREGKFDIKVKKDRNESLLNDTKNAYRSCLDRVAYNSGLMRSALNVFDIRAEACSAEKSETNVPSLATRVEYSVRETSIRKMLHVSHVSVSPHCTHEYRPLLSSSAGETTVAWESFWHRDGVTNLNARIFCAGERSWE